MTYIAPRHGGAGGQAARDPNPPVFVTAEAGPTRTPGQCPGTGRPGVPALDGSYRCPVCGESASAEFVPEHDVAPKYRTAEGLPVFVTARDRITMLESCLRGLLAHGFRNVTVIDNDSRAPIPSSWYKVVRTNNEWRHLAAWQDPAVRPLLPESGYYIVCDGDVAIDGDCPADVGPYLCRLMDEHPKLDKIGLQIRTDDLDRVDRYPETMVGQGTYPDIDEDLVAMPVDTHFAIYRSPTWPGIGGARTRAPYLCRHLPWYNRRFSDEEMEYYDRVGAQWATEHRAAELYRPKVDDVLELTTSGHVTTDPEVPDTLDDWYNAPPEVVEQALQVAWLLTRDPFMGGEFYRGYRPGVLTSKHFGWHTLVGRNLATNEDDPAGRVWCLTPESPPKAAMAPDVLVVRPVANLDPALIHQAHRNGQAVIADLDDNVWQHEDYLGRTREERNGDDDRYDEWFPLVDAVLASTRQLARYIREERLGPDGPPVFVAPNCFDVAQLAEASTVPGRVLADRLWLSGRMDADLEMYDEMMPKLLEDLDCAFMHVGSEPGHRFLDRPAWGDVPIWRVIERPSVPIPMFPTAFVGASVGVFFVAEHGFNEAKTLTHAVELAAMMPIVVASDLDIYQGKVPGLVRPEYAEVRAAVERLVSSPTAWHEERERCRKWAEMHGQWSESRYLRGIYNAVKAVVR